jgi:hypothetical protein
MQDRFDLAPHNNSTVGMKNNQTMFMSGSSLMKGIVGNRQGDEPNRSGSDFTFTYMVTIAEWKRLIRQIVSGARSRLTKMHS